MKLQLMACVLAALYASPSLAALKAGDEAPAFTAEASLAGKSFRYSLKESLAKGPVVVYFYPAAFTTGCNIQAHAFAVNYEKFAAAGASIVGVSLDSIGRLNAFSAAPDYCAGKIAVASDAGGNIAKAYDIEVKGAAHAAKDTRGASIDHGFAERTTFIVQPDGKIAATVGGLAPESNVQRTLEIVQRLRAAPRGAPCAAATATSSSCPSSR